MMRHEQHIQSPASVPRRWVGPEACHPEPVASEAGCDPPAERCLGHNNGPAGLAGGRGVYIVLPGKSGADWAAFTNWALGYYRDGAWEQVTPREG